MITIRRSEDRHRDHGGQRETWHSFPTVREDDSLTVAFGCLELLDESQLAPLGKVPIRNSEDRELITYVREGSLRYDDAAGGTGVIHADEFQSMMLCRGTHREEMNTSRTDGAQVFQIGMIPWKNGISSACEQKQFTAAQRRGRLRVVASPDGRNESLRIHQNALIFSALLEAGALPTARDRTLAEPVRLHQVEDLVAAAVHDGAEHVEAEAHRPFELDARRHRELLAIHEDLDERRSVVRERGLERRLKLLGLGDASAPD